MVSDVATPPPSPIHSANRLAVPNTAVPAPRRFTMQRASILARRGGADRALNADPRSMLSVPRVEQQTAQRKLTGALPGRDPGRPHPKPSRSHLGTRPAEVGARRAGAIKP